MLKKAGIVVAAAAAGLLALSPLAFAHESSDHESRDIEYTNVEEGNLSNDCEFSQEGPDIDQTLNGGNSLLGLAGLVTGLVAPVTTQTQAGNCTNIGVSDVIDSGSNNETTEFSRTEIEDSFNDVFED